MKLYVKYLQSDESLARVRNELVHLGVECRNIRPGEIEIGDEIHLTRYDEIRNFLESEGFQVISDRKSIIAERIRHCLIDIVYGIEEMPKLKLSEYLSEKFHLDYDYLASIFTEIIGSSVENFIIRLRVERVKELLITSNQSISQISYQMNYSSISHLSRQFRKVTGMTPKGYRDLHQGKSHTMKLCERCNSFL